VKVDFRYIHDRFLPNPFKFTHHPIIFLILDISVGMYMQKYISLLSIAQLQPHTHLQHVIRLSVSASRSHHQAYDRNYEQQNAWILLFIVSAIGLKMAS
jgi:hypothetical protein